MNDLGIGIIGCGNISTAYLRLAPLFKGIEMRAVADINLDAVKARSAEFGVRAETVDGLLAADDIDIVVNLTIPAAHFEVSSQILEAGKHVYSEKPFVLSLEEGSKIKELAEAGARYFAVPNLPTIQEFPLVRSLGDATTDELARIAKRTNHLLRPRLHRLEAQLRRQGIDVEIVLIDWNRAFSVLIRFPWLIGVENTTDPALNPPDCPPCTGVLVPEPDTYFWMDSVHATAPVHRALGLFALRDLRLQLLGH